MHNYCNRSGIAAPVYGSEHSNVLPVAVAPMRGSSLAATSTDDGSVSVFYQSQKGGIAFAEFECDEKTGLYSLSSSTLLVASTTNSLASHRTGLAATHDHDTGYRLYYADMEMNLQEATSPDGRNWTHQTLQTGGDNTWNDTTIKSVVDGAGDIYVAFFAGGETLNLQELNLGSHVQAGRSPFSVIWWISILRGGLWLIVQ